MSFILDALKKEQAQQDPAVRTALALDQRDRSRQRLVMYLVTSALCINVAVLLWLFAPDLLETSSPAGRAPLVPDQVAAIPNPGSSTAAEPIAHAPLAGARARPAESTDQVAAGGSSPSSQSTQPAPETQIPSSVPDADPADSRRDAREPSIPQAAARSASNGRVIVAREPARITLSELPGGARARFPGLAFSTHVYADDAALRAVVVNGQRLAEGDTIDSLVLIEITEEGALFSFEEYLVSISVLDSWD